MITRLRHFIAARPRRQRQHLAILTAYTLLVAALTWPLIGQLGTHVPGDPLREDHWVHLWTFDTIADALANGESLLYTDKIFHPHGISLASHNVAWLNILIWLPLSLLFGPIAAFSLHFLLIYIFNCFATYLLARDLAEDSLPAGFLGGLLFGFWPYLISHYDHPNLIFVGWIPLLLFFGRRLLHNGKTRDAWGVALSLFLLGLTRWQLVALASFLLALFLLVEWWQLPTERRKPAFWQLSKAVAGGGILLLPVAAPLLIDFLTARNPAGLVWTEYTTGQADLLAYIMPSRYHPLWGNAVESSVTYQTFVFNKFYTPSLLFSALPLICIAIWRRWTQQWVLIVLALLYFLLSLGPELRVAGNLYPAIPLPFRLIDDWFLIEFVRRPGRYSLMLGLPLALMAAIGFQQIRPYFQRKALGWVPFAWILFILFELLPTPFPTISTEIAHPWYTTLADEPEPVPIVTLPIERIPIKRAMTIQMSHDVPLVTGRIARMTNDVWRFIDEVPFLRELRLNGHIPLEEVAVTRQLEQLAAEDVAYLVIEHEPRGQATLQALAQWLPVAPHFADEQLTVYRLDDLLVDVGELEVRPAGSIGLISAKSLTPAATEATIQLSWLTFDAPQQIDTICFIIEQQPQLCEPFSPNFPNPQWQPDEIVHSIHQLPSAHSVTIHLYAAEQLEGEIDVTLAQ